MKQQTRISWVPRGSSLLLSLALLGGAVSSSHAAGPAPPGAPGAPTPTPYPLYGDAANSGSGSTSFHVGGWHFETNNTGWGFTMGVTCPHLGTTFCNGINVESSGGSAVAATSTGSLSSAVQGYANADISVGVRGRAGVVQVGPGGYGWNTAAGVQGEGWSYGGKFTATDTSAGVGVYGESPADGVHGWTVTGGYAGHFSTAAGTGASGVSTSGIGVVATSTVGAGLLAQSGASTGLYATTAAAGVGGLGGLAPNYGAVFSATNTSGVGVLGRADGTSGATGVRGTTTANYTTSYGGYFSANSGTGLYGGTTSGSGVVGFSNSGVGVSGSSPGGYGVHGYSGSGPGVQGWGGTTGSNIGVQGTSTSGYGGYATSASSAGVYAATTSGGVGLWAANSTKGVGHYAVLADGNVQITGSLWTKTHVGPLSAVPTDQGQRTLYGDLATQQIVSDGGRATLKQGHAVITFDPLYAQTVALDTGYQIYVTPRTLQTAGLVVINRTAMGFEVRERQGGRGSFSFDWRVDAVRKGHAGERLAPAARAPKGSGPTEGPNK